MGCTSEVVKLTEKMTLSGAGVQVTKTEEVKKSGKIDLPRYPLRFVKDDGTLKGAWISTIITFIMVGMFLIVLASSTLTANFEKVGWIMVSGLGGVIGLYLTGKIVTSVVKKPDAIPPVE